MTNTTLNVVAKMRIMPKNIDVKLDKILKKITEIVENHGKVHSSESTPIAFGLKALDINILLNDKKGGIEDIEDKVREISGVGEVTVSDVTLL